MYEDYRFSPERRQGRSSLPDTLYYDAPFNLYGVAFSHSSRHTTPRVALTSFISSSATNRIQIIQANASASAKDDFRVLTSAPHAYPPTKIEFEPVNPITTTPTHRGKGSSGKSSNGESELLATTGDLLRIWELQEDWHAGPSSRRIGEGIHQHAKEQNPWRDDTGRHSMDSIDENQPAWQLKERSKLSNSKSPASKLPPLTSFSWNSFSPSSLITSSIDTTCTIWDISTSTALTQLIAHDRSVYDVSFLPMSKDVFLSVGADGSLRAFDLRALEHSTILYETPSAKAPSPPNASASNHPRHQATDSSASAIPTKPLARISFSQKEQHYLAIFGFGDTAASILDMRNPGVPVAELIGHQKGLSAVGWGCESRASHGGGGWVATCGDDSQLLLYDLTSSLPYPTSAVSSTNSSPAPNAKSSSTGQSSSQAVKHTETLGVTPTGSPAAMPTVRKQPHMAWTANNGEINNLAWGRDAEEGAWIGAVSSKRLTCLRF
ncbi:hypothetical protein NliqN6_4239 [Naganishia liquefaciens]|uniref:WD40 repeat-like protein n=1 Tax=Naganishia liquefaciens TaxID=104408 RepID=A0A8H3YH39_9TREE|nr:hypothetical protein NliqN6_4239 [Naganishia liquefaciens]